MSYINDRLDIVLCIINRSTGLYSSVHFCVALPVVIDFFFLRNYWPAINECMWCTPVLHTHCISYIVISSHLLKCQMVEKAFGKLQFVRKSMISRGCTKASAVSMHLEPVLFASCVWYPGFHQILN